MDPSARQDFERLALPLLDNMYGVALRLTRDKTEAEDLVPRLMGRLGYKTSRQPIKDHAGGKWIFRYPSAAGATGASSA